MKIILLFCLYFFPSTNYSAEYDGMVLEKAIGHLITYQTERQLNGKVGVNSPLTEVFKTYYKDIELLSKHDRAMFLFMADNHLKIHGGSELIDFYNFVYLCCLSEYRQLIESNLSNRYLDSTALNRTFNIVKNLESSIANEARWRKLSIEEQKKIMRSDFLEMIKIVNDQEKNQKRIKDGKNKNKSEID